VGNLAYETTESDLRSAFSGYGDIISVKVVSNRRGQSKQFGYVEMESEATAKAAMEALRGTEVNGRIMDIVLENPSKGKRKSSPYKPGKRR
tara:strand:- start:165 stop:437 length:273 start_codon:yes stop_codon:yes gene_type:complete